MIDFKPFLQADYQGTKQFVKNILEPIAQNRIEVYNSPKNILDNSEYQVSAARANISSIEYIAKIETEEDPINVYDITVNDNCRLSQSKVLIQQFIRSHGEIFSHNFLIFHYANPVGRTWRFSYFYKELNGVTDPHRYTFVFGSQIPARTANDRFNVLRDSNWTTESTTDAFSVEALSKEFYNKLYDWYLWATSDEVDITFPNDPNTDKDDRDNKSIKTIRLITRVLFCWFIRQKGFIPAQLFDKEFISTILRDFDFGLGTSPNRYEEHDFDPSSVASSNYYAAVLQNLFFATLNNEVDKRGWANENPGRNDGHYGAKTLWRDNKGFSFFKQGGKDALGNILKNIPYMNGGLFECLDKMSDEQHHKTIYYDGFSRDNNRQKRAFVPNALFFNPESEGTKQGLFTLLEQYNFTVEENSANDAQVSLDPELLGRVFENLLADYNPETQESARKSTGSFYTPRIIVDYMVNESIKKHLLSKCNFIDEQRLNALINEMKRPELTEEESNQLITTIKEIKILDPACGSGAFPMGILLRMVDIIEILKPSQNPQERYNLKLDIINNCIYGVDIQPIAMLISKLRFFITLICEQESLDPRKENFGVHTLPNLETKFVAANTLLSASIHSFETDNLANDDLKRLHEELKEIRRKQFSAQLREDKLRYRREDKKKCEQIHKLLSHSIDESFISTRKALIEKLKEERKKYKNPNIVMHHVQEQDIFGNIVVNKMEQVDLSAKKRKEIDTQIELANKEIYNEYHRADDAYEKAVIQVTEWDPYDQNLSNPFFDAIWMFGVTDGFDIVIGNPPYIRLQNNDGLLRKLYSPCNYYTFDGDGDIYCLFYERGYNLLKEGGLLCFITSNKWMRSGYGAKTRAFFTQKTNPLRLIDFAGTKVFENATVDVNILLFAKEENKKQTLCTIANNKSCLINLNDFVAKNSSVMSFEGDDSWIILSPIEQSIKRKIESVGTPLKDWDIKINYGIKTGYNDAFIISTEKRNEILDACQTDEERTRTAELIRPILRGKDIKRYGYNWADLWLIYIPWHFPLHLDSTIKGASEKAGSEFNRLYPAIYNHLLQYKDQLSKRNKAETGIRYEWYALQRWGANYWEDFFKPKCIWTPVNSEYRFAILPADYMLNNSLFMMVGNNIYYLCALFNSKILIYYLNLLLNGDTYQYGSKEVFEAIPIKKISYEQENIFRELVEDIQHEYTKEKAVYIDNLLFDIYGLSEEEKELIGYIEIK